MKVFVTGGTGLIGSSLIPRLVASGHSVTCLARSDASATKAKSLGATPILGSHLDLAVLAHAAGEADGVIHLAFDHDGIADYVRVCDEDRAAIAAMCDALGSTGKPFVCANGTLMTAGETEQCGKIPIEAFPRWKSEDLTRSYADKGVRATTVRLPPVVHGPDREHPFISAQIAAAKEHKEAGYIGDGKQVWPSAHVDDAAAVFHLALEKGEKGEVYHAVGEEGVAVKAIAEAVGAKLGVEVKSLSKEEAMGRYGFVGPLMDMSNKTSSALTQQWLGWKPEGYGLLKEMEAGYKY
ncbi:NAD-dependent epimerase/dehydratase [Dioszegia hungarica]|uniref:NAD-dependent epimerase/dehydratase n=1 Tax=Dioszegia hungarica TaxID=4972 RepID=A0AA38HA58_9TREE|nr:NAD-dependent epimerase/dehydratase [Dioszegia hungarica]KAI9636486.1 NAD-dependent epimerase/dehydratase [Dioszegia hungarica]